MSSVIQSSILVIQTVGWEVLLLKRAPFLRHFPNMYCFPGGKRDGKESDFGTAIRETQEETGLLFEEKDLTCSGYESLVFPDGVRFIMAACHLRTRIPAPLPVTLSEEHTEYLWIRHDKALELDLAGPFTRSVLERL